MPWVIIFIYSWIIFFLLVDWKRLKTTVYGGLITTVLGLAVDLAGHKLDLYQFHDNIVGWMGNSLFYAAGLLFTMGVLFFQYLSTDRRLQMANVAVFSLAYLAVEVLIVKAGGASYVHWHYLASFTVDLLVFTALSYIGEIIVFGKSRLKKG